MLNVSKNSRLIDLMESVLKNRISFSLNRNVLNIIIVITHVVGVIGLTSKWRDLFIAITPIHLLLVFGILLITQSKITRPFLLFLASTVVISYLIEFVGVNTGSIFGHYEYGKALGLKIGNTPLLIGVLWFTLIYSIGIILSNFNLHLIIKSLLGALLMLLIDFFIEPVAMGYDFWSWKNEMIPMQNYLAWFIISFLMLIAFNLSSFDKSNPTAKLVYLAQLMFFITINIIS